MDPCDTNANSDKTQQEALREAFAAANRWNSLNPPGTSVSLQTKEGGQLKTYTTSWATVEVHRAVAIPLICIDAQFGKFGLWLVSVEPKGREDVETR